MADFDRLTFEDAKAIVDKNLPADHETNAAFAAGDHWQAKDGWIGPSPAESDSDADSVWDEIEAGFVSKNAIGEVLDRHADAVISQEPDYSLTPRRPLKDKEEPSRQERALIEEGTGAFVDWWDKRRVLRDVRAALRIALRGERCCLRPFVPHGILQGDTNGQLFVPLGTLQQSFKRLYLDVVEPDAGAIEYDPDTREAIGVFLFSQAEKVTDLETETKNFAELHYLDEKGQTVIRRVGENVDERITLNLGGRLAFYELRLDPFITAPIRSNQKLLNLALTMLTRNVVLGGFLERVIFNAAVPGRWVTDSETGVKTFVANDYQVGAGTSKVWSGNPIYGNPNDKSVITGYTTPTMLRFDPVPVDTFVETKKEAYRNILEEAKQLHVLISADATASGESRKQAERDFQRSLRGSVTAMNDLLRWLIETSLAMAAHFSGQPGRFEPLRAVASCNVDAEQISSSDIQDTIKLKEASIISTETAMVRVGVDDPAVELAKLAEEREANVEAAAQEVVESEEGADEEERQAA